MKFQLPDYPVLGRVLRWSAWFGFFGAILVGGCAESPQFSAHLPEQGVIPISATACPAGLTLEARFATPIDPVRPDNALMAEALHEVVNRERCLRGLPPVGLSPAAVGIATEHALNMAKLDFTGHHSPVPGRETFKRRLAAGRVGYHWAAENVARASAPLLAGHGNGCLAATGTGAAGPSYGEAAEMLMALWMASPGHRSNILDPRGRALGAGIGVDPLKRPCGEVAAAMVFVG